MELASGALRAEVRPGIGGSLGALWMDSPEGRVDVLRPAPADATHPLQMASFPLLPWCNRIAGGGFAWQGRSVRLAPTLAADPLPLHGYGWLARWDASARSPARVELRWRYGGGEWPWPFTAVQTYALDPDGLDVGLALKNDADESMPVGLGHHPYFPRDAATRVRAHLPTRIDTDAQLVPVAHVPNPDAQAFEHGVRIATLRLDHGFTGWDARAVVEQPTQRLRVVLHGEVGYAFHLYVPDAPYFCAEAVTNEPDAIHHPEAVAPMRTLGAGEVARYRMRLEVLRPT